MSIDYNLICDQCGKVIDGSLVSPAKVREQARLQGIAVRRGRRDLCFRCFGTEHMQRATEQKE